MYNTSLDPSLWYGCWQERVEEKPAQEDDLNGITAKQKTTWTKHICVICQNKSVIYYFRAYKLKWTICLSDKQSTDFGVLIVEGLSIYLFIYYWMREKETAPPFWQFRHRLQYPQISTFFLEKEIWFKIFTIFFFLFNVNLLLSPHVYLIYKHRNLVKIR